MNLFTCMGLTAGDVISFVGGGGKTTLMFRLAEEIPDRYSRLVTTTTKIYYPPAEKYPCFMVNDKDFQADKLIETVNNGTIAVLGAERINGSKLQGVTLEQFDQIIEWGGIDYILAEADGSKGRPLKGHRDYEPVISPATTLLVTVVGADVLGKRIDDEYVHRPEVAAELTGRNLGSIIDPETIACLLTHSRGVMRSIPPQARNIVIINKVDCLKSLDDAYRTARLLLSRKVQKVILYSALKEYSVVDIVTK